MCSVKESKDQCYNFSPSVESIDTFTWSLEHSIKEWWINLSGLHVPNRKAMTFLAILVG